MVPNQFYYIVEEAKDEKPALTGSFNLNKVVRTMNYDGDKIAIMLDDIHEIVRTVPVPGKNGKITQATRREEICSEIYLNDADSARYKALTEVGV